MYERQLDDYFYVTLTVKSPLDFNNSSGAYIYEFRLQPLELDKDLNITAPPKNAGYRITQIYAIGKKNKVNPYSVRNFPYGNSWLTPTDLSNRLIAFWYEKRIDDEYHNNIISKP